MSELRKLRDLVVTEARSKHTLSLLREAAKSLSKAWMDDGKNIQSVREANYEVTAAEARLKVARSHIRAELKRLLDSVREEVSHEAHPQA